MIAKNMQDAINKQINMEIYSSYLYMSMAANFEAMNLNGFAQWMKEQAREEVSHAMRFWKYLTEREGIVALEAIQKPKGSWNSAVESFEDAYSHETKVTSMIHDMARLADKENDFATSSMLKWFIDEQVEEEASTDKIVKKLRMVKDSAVLFMLDHELGKRGQK